MAGGKGFEPSMLGGRLNSDSVCWAKLCGRRDQLETARVQHSAFYLDFLSLDPVASKTSPNIARTIPSTISFQKITRVPPEEILYAGVR